MLPIWHYTLLSDCNLINSLFWLGSSFLFPCLYWLAAMVSNCQLKQDVKPISVLEHVSSCMWYQTKQGPTHKTLLYSTTGGQKPPQSTFLNYNFVNNHAVFYLSEFTVPSRCLLVWTKTFKIKCVSTQVCGHI